MGIFFLYIFSPTRRGDYGGTAIWMVLGCRAMLLIIIFLGHHQRCQEYDTPLLLEIHGLPAADSISMLVIAAAAGRGNPTTSFSLSAARGR
jgi:hypothetical protein